MASSAARVAVQRGEQFAASPGGDQRLHQATADPPTPDDIASEAERHVAVRGLGWSRDPLSEKDVPEAAQVEVQPGGSDAVSQRD